MPITPLSTHGNISVEIFSGSKQIFGDFGFRCNKWLQDGSLGFCQAFAQPIIAKGLANEIAKLVLGLTDTEASILRTVFM